MEKRNSIVFAVYLQFMLVLPAALSAAPAVPASTSTAAMTVQDEALVAGLQAKCQKGEFNFLDAASKAADIPAALRPNLPGEMPKVSWYFTCLASLPEPRQDCEALRGFPDQETSIQDCRRHTRFYTMIRKAFQSGDAALECQKLVSGENLVLEKDVPRFCALLPPAFRAGGTADFCAKVQAAGIVFKPGRSCAAPLHFLSGPAACDSAPLSAEDKRRCHDDAVLLKSLRSGDPRACAASTLCDAIINKNPRACGAYLAQANKGFCGLVARLAKAAEGSAARRREALANEAAAPERLRAIQKEEAARRAVRIEDPETAAKKAKKAEEVAAAKAAALKKSEAEAVRHKMISDIRQQRKAALLPKNEPPPQFKKGTPLQRVPPEIQKRIDAIEKQQSQGGQ